MLLSMSNLVRLCVGTIRRRLLPGIERLTMIGVRFAQSSYQARKVRLSNQFIGIAGVFHCAYAAVYALNGLWNGLWEPMIFCLLSVVVLRLNSLGHFAEAKALMLLMGNVAVYYASCIFNDQIPATQHMLGAVMLCAFWVVDESPKERIVLWFSVLTSVGLFFLIEADPWHHPLSGMISFTDTSLVYMQVLVPVSTFFLMITGAVYFQRDMVTAEWKLGEQNKLLEQQSVEIQLANNQLTEKNLYIEQEHQKLQTLYFNTSLLSQIGQRVAASSELDEVFETLYEGVQAFMEAAAFGVAIHNSHKNQLEFNFIIEDDVRQPPVICQMNNPYLLATYCARNLKEIWLQDVLHEAENYVPRLENAAAGKTAQSLMYLPLVSRERLIGIITVQSFALHAYSQYQLDMLRTLSLYAASAIENASERERSEQLLLNIMPASIAERLKRGETRIADLYDSVTVMFIDLVGFTELSTQQPPSVVVSMLDKIFSMIDVIAVRYSLEKIKTIGDAYMVVGGLPTPLADHTKHVALAAIEILDCIQRLSQELGLSTLSVRIGIDTGRVVAGVIGTQKFSYDLWGDTVNTASRMESSGTPEKIHVTEAVYKELSDCCLFEQCEPMTIKGKGVLQTYFLVGFHEQ
jgi:class 3 adenylate cyclase